MCSKRVSARTHIKKRPLRSPTDIHYSSEKRKVKNNNWISQRATRSVLGGGSNILENISMMCYRTHLIAKIDTVDDADASAEAKAERLCRCRAEETPARLNSVLCGAKHNAPAMRSTLMPFEQRSTNKQSSPSSSLESSRTEPSRCEECLICLWDTILCGDKLKMSFNKHLNINSCVSEWQNRSIKRLHCDNWGNSICWLAGRFSGTALPWQSADSDDSPR